jgi:hypothetical protein
MTQKAIGTTPDQGCVGQGDHARRPKTPQAGDYPNSPHLDEQVEAEQPQVRWLLRRYQEKHGEQPGDVQRDDEGIVRPPMLHSARGQESPGIAPGEGQFAKALQRDQQHHKLGEAEAVRNHGRSSAKPAVKPGPKAVISAGPSGGSHASCRSKAKSTVAADMLP